MTTNPLIYLGSPYTHELMSIREWRMATCAMFAAAARRTGHHCYSPIVECHTIEKYMPGDCGAFTHWQEYNQLMLRKADLFWILPLPGWELSRGLQGEQEYWGQLNKKANPMVLHSWEEILEKALRKLD